MNTLGSSIQCRALLPFDPLHAFARIRRVPFAGGVAMAVGITLLTAAGATHAADASVPQIQIETTFIEMPEATWKQMAGKGSWKVVHGQRAWTQLVVSTDHKEQEALAGAWFGNKAPGDNDTFLSLVFRALKQVKGVDVLTAPKVVTRSKQHATVEIVREFKYPTAWKPGAKMEDAWVPTVHATKDTGVTLNAKPSMLRGGKINLSVAPQNLELTGFKDLGHGREQPIFSDHKVQTNVALQSGQTVILGGSVREDQLIIEDKVPVLGDLPVIGRLFRSSQKQTSKSYLVVFITPRIVRGK